MSLPTMVLLAAIAALVIALGMLALRVAHRRPSNDRDWTPDMARLARGEIDGDTLTIHNLRDNLYPQPGEPYDTRWTSGSYDLAKLRRVWLAVEYFSRFRAVAHTFLSFEFSDGDALSVSVEARLPAGERYSIVRGLLRAFEVAYTFGTERDFVLRRAAYRRRKVLLLPLITPPDQARALLLRLVERANDLAGTPRFYNSVTENCTSTLADHANEVRPGSFPLLLPAKVMPGYSPGTLHRKGWIDTDLELDALDSRFDIGDRAREIGPAPDFSRKLREGLLPVEGEESLPSGRRAGAPTTEAG